VPSLTLYVRALAEKPARNGKAAALVVGNPLFDEARRAEVVGTVRRPQRAFLTRDGEVLEPLPEAEVEAKQVAALYGTTAAVGATPTERWFRERAGQASIIHLATHGYFRPFLPMSSGIALALPVPGGEMRGNGEMQGNGGTRGNGQTGVRGAEETGKRGNGGTADDGALQGWELMAEVKLNADLAVLSACETGRGAKVAGEGLVGLTRALQYAGVRSVVASQWKVQDGSTSRLMVAFHRGLKAGLSKDEALRRAMLSVRNDPKHQTAHPFYWAAFLLTGNPNPLSR
jgi:CHAT domain-containing protein